MSKELRITVSVPVSDNVFEQNSIVSKINDAQMAFRKALDSAAGGAAKFEAKIVSLGRGAKKKGVSETAQTQANDLADDAVDDAHEVAAQVEAAPAPKTHAAPRHAA